MGSPPPRRSFHAQKLGLVVKGSNSKVINDNLAVLTAAWTTIVLIDMGIPVPSPTPAVRAITGRSGNWKGSNSFISYRRQWCLDNCAHRNPRPSHSTASLHSTAPLRNCCMAIAPLSLLRSPMTSLFISNTVKNDNAGVGRYIANRQSRMGLL